MTGANPNRPTYGQPPLTIEISAAIGFYAWSAFAFFLQFIAAEM